VRRDLGDFQTPRELAEAILRVLGPIGSRWQRVLEPTCGSGSFLQALLAGASPPRELIGIEVQEEHWTRARLQARSTARTRVEIVQASLFDLDLRTDLVWHHPGPLLVVGNPPWVTSAELGRMGSRNLPGKRNLKTLPGLAALTGAANFDIAEAIWLKLLDELAGEQATLALLCKRAVARAVLEHARRRMLPIVDAAIFEIDAARWFGAAVGACLLRVTMGGEETVKEIAVFGGLDAPAPLRAMGFRQERLCADAPTLDRHAFAIGTCPLIWRQGLKHDAATIMELQPKGAGPREIWQNRLGQEVDVEPALVYPLVKGTDLRNPLAIRPRRAVIVTQERIGQETSSLKQRAPRLWAYLSRHADRFASRKSSIYRGKPPFSLFGIGPYSFARWKVAVSGLHRPATFRAVGPVEGRPVMFDDTCYLLPCDSAARAAVLTAICNHSITIELIAAMSFPDAKRPVTKGLLQRIDLWAILDRINPAKLAEQAEAMLGDPPGMKPDLVPGIRQEIEQLRCQFHENVRPRYRRVRRHGLRPDQLP
jgi:hypothetical protein